MSKFWRALLPLALLVVGLLPAHLRGDEAKPTLLVTVAPLAFYADRLAGDLITIESLVPPGANPHAFEPTPKQVMRAASAIAWFQVGELFEKRISASMRSRNPALVEVNLLNAIPILLESNCPHCRHHAEGRDPHIWLSARSGQKIAAVMASTLSTLLPESANLIDERLATLTVELQTLDSELSALLAPYKGSALLVSHASFGYFCHDYGLTQRSIEIEGKEPTARQFAELLKAARGFGIRCVILQPQYSSKGAELVARELKLPTRTIDPMSTHIEETLRALGSCVATP